MKILEADFRQDLYKNLVDAGYEKNEAKKIVGIKYADALKTKVSSYFSTIQTEHENNVYNALSEEWLKTVNADIEELNKMISYVS